MKRVIIIILMCFPFMLLLFGCAAQQKPVKPEVVEQPVSAKPAREVTPEMIEEYAMIHQMSDLKTAEFYLTHPDYAKENPYKPTREDIMFYERKFLVEMFPSFERYEKKGGSMRAYASLLLDPPGDGSIDPKAKILMSEKLKKSEFVDNTLGEAIMFYNAGRLDDAIKQMEIAVEADPDSPTMLYDLGVMCMKKGDYPRAIDYFRSSILRLKATGYTSINIAIHPKVYLGACVNLGMVYTTLGMYNDAVKILKEAIQFKENDLDANWNLALAYWFLGDMEEANAQMRRYIDIDPDNAEAHNAIGLLYYRKELYNAALDEFRNAAKLNPQEKQYSYNEGIVLAKLGRYDEAQQAFDRSSGLKEGEDVRQTFSKQIAANKVRELYNDGCTAMENLNYSQAIELFNAALELKPDMADAHVNLGACYAAKGDLQKQIHHLEEAAKLRPDKPNIHYSLGTAYYNAGMYTQAMEEFKKAIEIRPSFQDAHFKLGMSLCNVRNYTGAIVEFEKCLELHPDWYEARVNLGTCYSRTGNPDGAIEQFKEAARLRPGIAEAHYNLGAAYMNAKKLDEAYTSFQKALEIDPGHRQAAIMLKEIEVYKGK